jgi:Cu+-exporting ATPase
MTKRILLVSLFVFLSVGGWWLAKSSASPAQVGAAVALSATTPAADEATCPVTGETHKKADMTPYAYQGVTYYFCCPACLPKFKADPDKYIKPAA